MSEMYPLPTIYLKHRGFFDLSAILQTINGWYDQEDFHSVEWPKHKQKPPKPQGIEVEINFAAWKRFSEYVRMHVNVFIHVFDMRDVEVIRDGKKIAVKEGKIAIEITPHIEFDYQNRFGGSKFLQALQDFYHKYIIKYKINDYWEDLVMEKAGDLGKLVQSALNQEVV